METRIAREILILFGLAALTVVLLPLAHVNLSSPAPFVVFFFLVTVRVLVWALRVTWKARQRHGTAGPKAA